MPKFLVGNNTLPPDPHPVDSDWRFSDYSVERIIQLLPPDGRVLAVGTPSIARRLEQYNKDVLLIDRQPLQGVRNHRAISVGEKILSHNLGSCAVLDPPWYKVDMQKWLTWSAHLLGANSQLIFPKWPDSTRPTAAQDWDELVQSILPWGSIDALGLTVEYQIPPFERHARLLGGTKMSESPLSGEMVVLHVHERPTFQFQEPLVEWHRFVVNDYQLSISLTTTRPKCNAFGFEGTRGRYWPFVSSRAPNRNMIGVWSSDNEAGCIDNGDEYVELLRRALVAPTEEKFELAMQKLNHLRSWNIPRPPYTRVCEWIQ